MKVGIYGSGNLAWHLTRWFSQKRTNLVGLSGRDSEKCKKIWPDFLMPDELEQKADIIFLAVPDAALSKVASQFEGSKKIIAHCSGATSLNVLSNHFENAAVSWPLQSFTRDVFLQYDEIHTLIDASNQHTLQTMLQFWQTLTRNVHPMTEKERQTLHLAAVFSSNFVNHLIHISHKLVSTKGLDLELIQPLIEATVAKAFETNPLNSQTGPARRNDLVTIEAQLKLLAEQPEWKTIYSAFTQSIIKTYELQTTASPN